MRKVVSLTTLSVGLLLLADTSSVVHCKHGGYARPGVHMGVREFNATEVYTPPKVRSRHDVRMEEDKRMYASFEKEYQHDQNVLHERFGQDWVHSKYKQNVWLE